MKSIVNWGFIIKQLREAKGYTQVELAKRSGLNRSIISRIELGHLKTTNQYTFSGLAKGLGMTLDELNEAITGERLIHQQEPVRDAYARLGNIIPIDIPIYPEFTLHFGEGVDPLEYIPYARAKAVKKDIRGFIGHGDCLSPKIEDGDIVILDKEAPIEHDDYAACLLVDQVHVGQLKSIGGELFLINKHGRIPIKDCHPIFRIIEVIKRL